jgi:hypothetical protein
MGTTAVAGSVANPSTNTPTAANDNLLARLPVKPNTLPNVSTPTLPGGTKPAPVPTGDGMDAITRPAANWLGDRVAPLSNPKVMAKVMRYYYKANAPKASADAATAYIQQRNPSLKGANAQQLKQMLEGFYVKADKAKTSGGMAAAEVERYATPLAKRATSTKAGFDAPTAAEAQLLSIYLERSAARKRRESENSCVLVPQSSVVIRQAESGNSVGAAAVGATVRAQRNRMIDPRAKVTAEVSLNNPRSIDNWLASPTTATQSSRGQVRAVATQSIDADKTSITGKVGGQCTFESEYGRQTVEATVIAQPGIGSDGKVNVPVNR